MSASDAFKTSKKLRRVDGMDAVVFHCPACETAHRVDLGGPGQHWSADGTPDHPTFWPSIKVTRPTMIEDEICHSFITIGRISYCADSTHKLAGQIIDMPDWPHPKGKYGGIIEISER